MTATLSDLHQWLIEHGADSSLEPHPIVAKYPDYPGISDSTGSQCLRVRSDKGVVSVIQGECSFGDYEIWSLEGNLFDDVEHFDDVAEAGERIIELLKGGGS